MISRWKVKGIKCIKKMHELEEIIQDAVILISTKKNMKGKGNMGNIIEKWWGQTSGPKWVYYCLRKKNG